MRVLYFTRDYTPHDYRFLSALAATEHEIFSLRLERRGLQLEERPLPAEVTSLRWKGGQVPFEWKLAPALAVDFKRVAAQVKPDLIHAGPVPTVAFLAALSGFQPLASMSWGSDLLRDIDHHPWLRWCAGFALRRSQVLFGDCLAVQKKAGRMGFPAGRVVLFPWGVDLSHFCPGPAGDLRARLGWQENFVLLSLRSWEPVYGIDVMLRGFARAARQNSNLRLLLYGSGTLAGRVHQLIAENGLQDKIYLGGSVTNRALPEVYRSADLYLSASHSDGSSVSLLEALACGLPALVSAIPGNLEWITPGVVGWLFADGDEGALAEGITQAVCQRDHLAQMSQAALALAAGRADWTKNFQRLLEGYRMAVKKKDIG
jgi:glycosyltransferase involved in cell wall biosynthesis